MRRVAREPRPGWQRKVEDAGFPLHTPGGRTYWDESAAYELEAREAEVLEAAANELHARCLDAVQHVVDRRLYPRFRIPELAAPLVERSWNALAGAGDPSIYGRMDLAWDGRGAPKLLEYNADTPTALVEAAVVQWRWLEEAAPGADQLNSIHERLVAGWKDLKPFLPAPLHVSSLDLPEDVLTASYLQDTAAQAGLETRFLRVEDIGWRGADRAFVDLEGSRIRSVFKLYPWEWMVREPFAAHLPEAAATTWVEPPWKMVLSCKALLPLLWELFPDHPNLLPAFDGAPGPLRSFARKPLYGREGANVALVERGATVAEGPDGGYGAEGFVFQALADARPLDGRWPVLGLWLVQGEAAGLGVRESDGRITDDASRFVPHLLR